MSGSVQTPTDCPRCGTATRGGNFCTTCGHELAGASGRSAGDAIAGDGETPEPEVRLTACPTCGAPNAASRLRCGRCRTDLTGLLPSVPPAYVPTGEADHDARESTGLLVLATIVAALAVVGVGLTMLSARGLGPFAGPQTEATARDSAPVPADVTATRASSRLEATAGVGYGSDTLIDGDPMTAWNEAAPGPGTGEWVELRLAAPAEVTGFLMWNGYQKGDAFEENNRVKALRIDLDDRRFTVRLLDRRGPLAVNLPESVRAERVRLTVETVYLGDRYNDAALSEIQVLVAPTG